VKVWPFALLLRSHSIGISKDVLFPTVSELLGKDRALWPLLARAEYMLQLSKFEGHGVQSACVRSMRLES
jgi:hypothetical protein